MERRLSTWLPLSLPTVNAAACPLSCLSRAVCALLLTYPHLSRRPRLRLPFLPNHSVDEHAEKLMQETMSRNFIDYEEYPATIELHNRAVNMIARLFNAPIDKPDDESLGVSTIGSSEAIILAVLAMKKKSVSPYNIHQS